MRGWFSGPGVGVLDTRYLRLDASNDPVTGALTLQNDLFITTANGLDVNPGGDIDADLSTVGVTGAPRFWWDESEDSFSLTKPLQTSEVESTGNTLNLYSNVGNGLEIQLDGTIRLVGTDPDIDVRPSAATNISYKFNDETPALVAQMLITCNSASGDNGQYIFDSATKVKFRDAPNGTEYVRFDSNNQSVRIGAIAVNLGKLIVDQNSTTAAKPVLYLDQADVSEEMIQFATTIGVGNAIEAVGVKTLTTTHFIKVTLPGGLTRYIPAGTIA